jgi:methyl-accepting chemotaxis protein
MTSGRDSDRLYRIEALIENTQRQVDSNSRTINQLAEYQAQVFTSLRELTEVVQQVSRRVDSLVATSERYDRILDYLMRRDGEYHCYGSREPRVLLPLSRLLGSSG